MKRNFISVMLFFTVYLIVEAGEYDLAAYLARVRQYNPDIALASKEIALAKTSVAQARAAFLPAIGLQGGYSRNFLDSMRSTPVASLPGGGPLVYQDVDSNYDNELTFGLGVTQTLFDAGAIANYNKARKGQAIREESSEAVKQNIQSAAKKLYAQTQLVLMVVEIMEASERLSHDIYESTERKYRAGADTELNLLMAEVDWKTKITSTAEAQKNAELALIAFRNLAGIPLSEAVTLTEPPEDLPAIPDVPALETVLGLRHDYRMLTLTREMADLDRRAAAGAFLPTASASFSYGLGGMGNGSSGNSSSGNSSSGNSSSLVGDYAFDSAALSLKISIPLFAGGYRLARMEAAKLEQDKADVALLNRREAIESDLSKLSLRFKEAAQRVESARLIVAAAERAVSLSQTAYANGLATQLTVADAINKLGSARLGLHSAIFEYRASYYDWENTIGLVK
ncbi:adeC/adeK/oprM family multidrug efflux complex outer membrane factor [Spirochaetia bacterium]|nr:adeC/adeK/oprM family multidrug efflux complex outer membrane factor [Spirochaetia bacterium]